MKYLHPTAPAPHIQSNHLPRNDLNFSPVSLSLVAGSLSIPLLPPPLSFCPCDLILVVVVCSTLECSHLMRFTFISFSLEPHSLMLCVCVCRVSVRDDASPRNNDYEFIMGIFKYISFLFFVNYCMC